MRRAAIALLKNNLLSALFSIYFEIRYQNLFFSKLKLSDFNVLEWIYFIVSVLFDFHSTNWNLNTSCRCLNYFMQKLIFISCLWCLVKKFLHRICTTISCYFCMHCIFTFFFICSMQIFIFSKFKMKECFHVTNKNLHYLKVKLSLITIDRDTNI